MNISILIYTIKICLANKWVNQKYNFDNLGHALMSLFVLSSKVRNISIYLFFYLSLYLNIYPSIYIPATVA